MLQIQKSFKDNLTSGTLYLVPTPIGNLQDITIRALETLKTVQLIASEDTRNTQRLLNHFEIKQPQISFHEHNYQTRIPELIAHLNAGDDLAQVSDAGMPSISDPGHELVKACLKEGIAVVSLPGATAGVTALIASGLPSEQFTFYGFLARKKNDQLKELEQLTLELGTLIFYESPHRLKATFKNMESVFGETRQAVLCRELTKIHEEYIRGSLADVSLYLSEHDLKGECCILIAPADEGEVVKAANSEWEMMNTKEHVDFLIRTKSLSSKEAIKEVAKLRALKKQDIYKDYHDF